MMRAARTRLLIPIALPLVVLACADVRAAIPGALTAHARVLGADVILVARCTFSREREWPGGALYSLKVLEVLANRPAIQDLESYLLDNSIPGSSAFGDRHFVPTDLDVVIFAHADRESRILSLLGFAANSVVPLRPRFREYLDPKYQSRSMSPADFVSGLKALIREFQSFDALKQWIAGATGSRHPFSLWDRGALLSRLLELDDPRVPAFAREVLESRDSGPVLSILCAYFAKEPPDQGLPVLRELFAKHFSVSFPPEAARASAADPAGDKDVSGAASGARARKDALEKLLTVSGALLGAGQAGWLRPRLLPAYRREPDALGPALLLSGERSVLEEALQGARAARSAAQDASTRKGEDAASPSGAGDGAAPALGPGLEESPHLLRLMGVQERTCVLGVIRLAFELESAEATGRILGRLMRSTGFGPDISFTPGLVAITRTDADSRERMLARWQKHWREHARQLPSVFPDGTLESILGADPAWAAP